jgi:hypothetical protein
LGGGSLKELRLLRGAVGLTWILVPVCGIALLLSYTEYKCHENQRRWSLFTFFGTIALYFALIIPSYWDVEYEEHSTIWAGFPAKLGSLTTDNMTSLLPCAKMKMVAEGKKHEADPDRKPGTSK